MEGPIEDLREAVKGGIQALGTRGIDTPINIDRLQIRIANTARELILSVLKNTASGQAATRDQKLGEMIGELMGESAGDLRQVLKTMIPSTPPTSEEMGNGAKVLRAVDIISDVTNKTDYSLAELAVLLAQNFQVSDWNGKIPQILARGMATEIAETACPLPENEDMEDRNEIQRGIMEILMLKTVMGFFQKSRPANPLTDTTPPSSSTPPQN